MKKLVTAFALCASISAMAAVTSENIVGYTTVAVPKGACMLTPSFTTVGAGGTELTLSMVVPSSAFYADQGFGDSVQFLNTAGSGAWELAADYWEGLGWFKYGTEEEVGDRVLKKGEAFYVFSSQIGGATFQFAGEIDVVAFQVAVPKGATMIGNSIPAAGLTLADIVPNSAFYADQGFGDSIQFLNASGSGVWELAADYWENLGWFKYGTEEAVGDRPINIGNGFYVFSSQNGGAAFNFPAIQ
jgi:hypothetical protein